MVGSVCSMAFFFLKDSISEILWYTWGFQELEKNGKQKIFPPPVFLNTEAWKNRTPPKKSGKRDLKASKPQKGDEEKFHFIVVLALTILQASFIDVMRSINDFQHFVLTKLLLANFINKKYMASHTLGFGLRTFQMFSFGLQQLFLLLHEKGFFSKCYSILNQKNKEKNSA